MPLGKAGVLKYKVGGQAAGGSWVEMLNIRDVTNNLETNLADVTTRGSGDWREQVPVLNNGSIEFTMLAEDGDTDYEAFADAFHDRTVLGIQLYLVDGGSGLQGDFQISNFTHDQPLEEYQTISVTLTPTRDSGITRI